MRVQHLRFEIPSDADVERQAFDRRPVILDVCPDLLVVRVEMGIPRLIAQEIRGSKVVCLSAVPCVRRRGVLELWNAAVVLDAAVLHEVEAEPSLEYVVAGPTESRICNVVPESDTPLLEVLVALVAPDQIVTATKLVVSQYEARRVR